MSVSLHGVRICGHLHNKNVSVSLQEFCRNVIMITVICEDCCYQDPTSVFRSVCVEGYVSWKPISDGEILIVVRDWWHVCFP